MRSILLSFAMALICSSCGSNLAMRGPGLRETDAALEEMRMDLADVRHALNSTQVELNILEDKLKNQDNAIFAFKDQASQKSPQINQLNAQISALEKKLVLLEKIQEKSLTDLRQLSSHANQTSGMFSQYKEKMQELEREIAAQNRKFDEFAKLKTTLSSISKLMKQNIFAEELQQTYKVKSGDTLEGIARGFRCTVEALKKANHLNGDKIMAGQEMKIPYDNNG